MKKILSILALASLLFSACKPDGDFGIKPEESKLKYAQEGQVILPEDFTISSVNTVNLGEVTEETVKVVDITLPSLSKGELGKLVMTLSSAESEETADIAIDNTGHAAVADLQAAVEKIYNKRPVERLFTAEIEGDVVIDKESFVCKPTSTITVGLIPEAPVLFDNYYVVGGSLDWKGSCQTKEQKFNHSDKDVYEDPFFHITIPANAGGDTWFAIGDDIACNAVAENDNYSLLYGNTKGNGESGESGSFKRRTELTNDGSFKVEAGCSFIRITLDVMAGTYTVTPIVADKFYIIGGPNDWVGSCQTKELKFNHSDKSIGEDPMFSIVFKAAASGDTWFAIGDDKACDSVAVASQWKYVFGTTNGNGQSGASGVVDRRMNLTDDGSFKVAEGCSYIKVTLNGLTFEYTVEELNFAQYIYEIGNESGWSTSHPMCGPEYNGKYQGYYYLDGEFKFKPNADNWDGDWENGGVYDSQKNWSYIIQEGGSNFPAPYNGAGFYQINVDFGTGEATIEQVNNLSLIGDFNGWSADTDLTYNVSEGCWEGTQTFSAAGGFKIRLNHDWTISWGGRASGTDYSDLTYFNGQNLSISDPGTYSFKFFLSTEGHNKIEISAIPE